jgi:integrase
MSPVVHRSRGSGSVTPTRLQRSRCLIAAGVFGPDHGDRDSPVTRFGYHVGGAAVYAIDRTEDWRSWKTLLMQAGVRAVRVHGARHTAATLLIEQGVHIRVVQEVLGYTRVTTTERCTHVAALQMKDASERMSEALWGPRVSATATKLRPWPPRESGPLPEGLGEDLRAAG